MMKKPKLSVKQWEERWELTKRQIAKEAESVRRTASQYPHDLRLITFTNEARGLEYALRLMQYNDGTVTGERT